MNLIDKKELMKLLDDMFSRYDGTSNLMVGWKSGLDAVISEVSVMPTIDAEPVRHGYWIYCRSKNNNIKQYQCSECGKHMWTMDKYLKEEKYCFKCGAKMDIRKDSQA